MCGLGSGFSREELVECLGTDSVVRERGCDDLDVRLALLVLADLVVRPTRQWWLGVSA
jgi:hypothetical protein